jgi:dephospho-CoA kinase
MKPRFKLGITGGIGSGKTSVCKVFEVLGIGVFSADIEAQRIMNNDMVIIRGINSIAGKDMYNDGSLNRTELASIVFNDKDILMKVNSLVHPAVFENFSRWTLTQSSPYVIMEAAILFESGGSQFMDRIATVAAPVEQRIERIIQRNKLSRDQVMNRMRNQMDDQEKIKRSDYIIQNSENDMIIPSILKIHNEILALINTKS